MSLIEYDSNNFLVIVAVIFFDLKKRNWNLIKFNFLSDLIAYVITSLIVNE